MLIVGVFCGLASQMNQYAFALMLRKRFPSADVRLLDGCDWMRDSGHNGYELNRVFGIKPDKVDLNLVKKLANFYPEYGLKAKAFNAMYQLRDKIIGPRKTQIMMNETARDSAVLANLDLSRDWLFWGNAQAWVYGEVEEEMRRAFAFRIPLEGENARLADEMAKVNSVSIHLRRGDYIKFGFQLLGEDYYQRAVTKISEVVADPHYYVFSDDLDEAHRMFSSLRNVTFVTGNRGPSSYIDMQLMSLCKNNIIANSGFSFMGAWLNDNPDKVIVGHASNLPVPGYLQV